VKNSHSVEPDRWPPHGAEREQAGEAPWEGEVRFRILAEFSPLGISLHTPDGRMVYCNRAMSEMLGYSREELFVLNPSHPEDEPEGQRLWRELVEGRRHSYRREKRYVRKDGQVLDAQLRATAIPGEGGDVQAVLLLFEDITERKQAEERTRRLLDRQIAINQLTLALGFTLDLEKIYDTIIEHVRQLMDTAAFIISRYDPQTQLIHADYVVTDGVKRDVSTFPPIPLEEEGHGTQSQVIRTGRPLYVPDLRKALESTQTEYTICENGSIIEGPPPAEAKDESSNSALYVPMKIAGETVGVMQVQSCRLDAYDQDDEALLAGLANVAALAIQNARLLDTLRRSNKELRRYQEHLEDLVAERTAELRKLVTLMAGREVRMAELKDVIRKLRAQLEEAGLRPVADDPLLAGQTE